VLVDATQQTDQRTSQMVYLFFAEALRVHAKISLDFRRSELGQARSLASPEFENLNFLFCSFWINFTIKYLAVLN